MMHASWCRLDHDPVAAPCTRDIGEIRLSEDLTFSVALFKPAGEGTEVQLLEDAVGESSVLGLTLDETLLLRDLLSTASALVLQEGALL